MLVPMILHWSYFDMSEFPFAGHGFDEHIEKSIRGYKDLHDDVIRMSSYFIQPETNVFDLGSSTGKTIESLYNNNFDIPMVNYTGIDSCSEFHKIANSRGLPDAWVQFELMNLTDARLKNVLGSDVSFVTSLFTLQFVPAEYRQDIINAVYNSLDIGGAFVIAEKVIDPNSRIQEMMRSLYYQYKLQHFSAEEILQKERRLRPYLKESSPNELYEMMQKPPWRSVHEFWKSHLFTAIVAIK